MFSKSKPATAWPINSRFDASHVAVSERENSLSQSSYSDLKDKRLSSGRNDLTAGHHQIGCLLPHMAAEGCSVNTMPWEMHYQINRQTGILLHTFVICIHYFAIFVTWIYCFVGHVRQYFPPSNSGSNVCWQVFNNALQVPRLWACLLKFYLAHVQASHLPARLRPY